MVEFFLNANFLKFVISLLMYLSLNLSRMLLCKGITMVFWSYLTVPEFEYSGTCKLNGVLVLPKIPKMVDPNRIQRQFESGWERYWNAIKKHVSSMLGRVGCKGFPCLWRCGVRCLGLCCVPCTFATNTDFGWTKRCRAWTSRVYILIGGKRSDTGPGADIESRDAVENNKWSLDSIYDFENTRIPYQQNKLSRDENSNHIDMKPNKDHATNQSEGDAVRALLRRGLLRYQLEGCGYVILSILVNVPWIVIRSAVAGQINYQ